ncbi:MAG: hypothetical protein FJ087_12380 [Deltaproteobacteria bacterium]|nr:hypothetical protein [Deltaproteobacteria bacterium]
MSLSVYVIDTSYLLEIYRVPGFSDERDSEAVRRRFRGAADAGARFYVPVAALFELADHIADVRNGEARQRLADRVVADIHNSLHHSTPWVLTPPCTIDDVLRLTKAFQLEFAKAGVGLSDTVVIEEARRLKTDRYKHPSHFVHIWTKDGRMKPSEPDPEPRPFLGHP